MKYLALIKFSNMYQRVSKLFEPIGDCWRSIRRDMPVVLILFVLVLVIMAAFMLGSAVFVVLHGLFHHDQTTHVIDSLKTTKP